MELPAYIRGSESTCRRSVLSHPTVLCRRYDPPLADHVHGFPCATSKDVCDSKHFERVAEELDDDITPFVKIDQKTIQHFSHDYHHLRLQDHANSCDHENKFCQACCLQLISSKRFYGCMECDFVLHEECACLPRRKQHPLHKHTLALHPFPLKPKFEAYVKRIFSCDGCDQLNCGFMYKCIEKDCGFQLDVRCASLMDPSVHGNFHQHDHPLFFSKTRGICRSCKSSKCSRYLLECRKCNFVLGLKCATLPCAAPFIHDKHPLNLCYDKENIGNLQYWCEICESKMDTETWFYTCDTCKVNLHVECLLGRDVYMKPHHIININDEEVEIVRNDGISPAFCFVCGRRCMDTLIFKWINQYSCTFLCSVTFFLQ